MALAGLLAHGSWLDANLPEPCGPVVAGRGKPRPALASRSPLTVAGTAPDLAINRLTAFPIKSFRTPAHVLRLSRNVGAYTCLCGACQALIAEQKWPNRPEISGL